MADSFSLRDMNSLMTGRAPSATARADGGGLLGVLGAQSVDTEDTVDDTGFASLLAGSALPADSAKTDRITELLTNRAPSLDEVGAAASRAAFGLEGFGEALTKMRASKLAEQKTLFSVLSAQQAQQQRTATLDIQRQRLDLDTLKMLAERGDKNAKAVQDAIKFSIQDPQYYNAALMAVQDSKIPVDANNAYSVVPQIVADKGIPTTAAKKESAAGFQPVETGEGVFAFDRSTGQMGQRLGGAKPSSGSSEYERLEAKASAGTASDMDMKRLKQLTDDNPALRERMRDEVISLLPKIMDGTATPEDRMRFSAAYNGMGTVRNQEGVGTVRIPGMEVPGMPSGPQVLSPAVPKPLPTAVSENLTQAMQAIPALERLEAGLSETGRIQGMISKGQTLVGANPKAIEFETGRANLKLAAQALIKGIPSNFDVQTVIDTLPDLTLPESINRSRMAFTRNALRMMTEATIGYYKGLNYNLPPALLKFAASMGVDPNETSAMSQDDLESRTQAINAQLKAASQGIAAGVTPGARIRVDE